MSTNMLKKRLQAGKACVNGWLAIPSGFSAEVMAQCGWDSVTVDIQHGVQDYQSMVQCFQAMDKHPITPLVRVPWNEPGIIGKCLDGGAMGGLDRSALLGRAGHPKHRHALPGGHRTVDTGPVPRARTADQRLTRAWVEPRTQLAERGGVDRRTVAHDRAAAAPPHPAAVREVVLVAPVRPGFALAVIGVV